MKISIITIAKNCLEDLSRTRSSVEPILSDEVEHVIIDADSKDGTNRYLESIDDEYTRWKSEPDFGISDAFNKGIAESRGDWIVFINSGDVLKLAAWNTAKNILGKTKSDILTMYSQFGNKTIPKRALGNKELLFARSLISHQGSFVNRKIFEKYGGFDIGLRVRMDYDFWMRVLRFEKFDFIPIVLVDYKIGGVSSKEWRMYCTEEILVNKRYLGPLSHVVNIRPHIKLAAKTILFWLAGGNFKK